MPIYCNTLNVSFMFELWYIDLLTKAAVVYILKWIFRQHIHRMNMLTDIYSHWPRSVLHTHALPSPLTLCVWRAVPFTLIKTTNAPIPPTPLAHAPLPSALITEPSISLIGVISSSERPSSSPVCSHLWEVCRRDRGHRLWRADVHRVPQCRYKEVRKRTRGTSSSIQLLPACPL